MDDLYAQRRAHAWVALDSVLLNTCLFPEDHWQGALIVGHLLAAVPSALPQCSRRGHASLRMLPANAQSNGASWEMVQLLESGYSDPMPEFHNEQFLFCWLGWDVLKAILHSYLSTAYLGNSTPEGDSVPYLFLRCTVVSWNGRKEVRSSRPGLPIDSLSFPSLAFQILSGETGKTQGKSYFPYPSYFIFWGAQGDFFCPWVLYSFSFCLHQQNYEKWDLKWWHLPFFHSRMSFSISIPCLLGKQCSNAQTSQMFWKKVSNERFLCLNICSCFEISLDEKPASDIA